MSKSIKQLERHFKGIANHYRLEILFIVATNRGIILDDIAHKLKCNLKTTAEHTRRLFHAGLIKKKYRGRNVTHTITPIGEEVLKFIKTFSLS